MLMDSHVLSAEQKQAIELDRSRWINRRMMAWRSFWIGSFISLALTALIAFGSESRVHLLSELGAVILGIMGFFGGIVMAYIGSAAYSDVRLWGKSG